MNKTIDEVRTLANVRADIEENITAYNDGMFNKNIDTMEKANMKQDELEQEYSKLVTITCFEELKNTDNPMLEAIKKYSYTVLKHKDLKDKETGIVKRELAERERQIDLRKLDVYCKHGIAHDEHWQYTVEKFNQLLCMRAATDLNLDTKAVANSFYMNELSKQIDLGKTPTSNTQLLKQLQSVIDTIVYEDKDGKNAYKAKSQDVSYLVMLYTKKGKERLSVSTAKHDFMRRLIMDILHRIVTEKAYTLEYKTFETNKKLNVSVREIKSKNKGDKKDTKKSA